MIYLVKHLINSSANSHNYGHEHTLSCPSGHSLNVINKKILNPKVFTGLIIDSDVEFERILEHNVHQMSNRI